MPVRILAEATQHEIALFRENLMRPLFTSLVLLIWITTMVSQAGAHIIVYTSQTAFQAEAPGLTMQDFSAAQVPDGSFAFVDGPLDASTDNGVFSPGDIAAGLVISADGSQQAGGDRLFVAGAGTVGNTLKTIYTNGSDSTMNLSFAGASAVGLKLIGFTNNAPARRFTLTIESSIGSLPFTTDVIPDVGGGVFFGLIGTSGEQISRVRFQSGIGANEGITHVEFGALNPVPEPSGRSLYYLVGLGYFCLGRRNRTP